MKSEELKPEPWNLKAASKREQSHARMNSAEREQARPEVKPGFRHPAIKPDDEADAPQTRPTNRDPENENIIVLGPFYRVTDDIRRAPIRDYLDHGYESRRDFYDAVSQLMRRWRGREGECFEERAWHGKEGEAIDQRHRALHLRFHDTPGGLPDEAWLPLYLLEPIPTPPWLIPHEPTEEELLQQEIDEALGF